MEAQELVRNVVGLLKKHRESLGWSQRKLASNAGVDPKTVSVIERGIRSPTLFTLSLLSSAVGQPLWEVMREAHDLKKISK